MVTDHSGTEGGKPHVCEALGFDRDELNELNDLSVKELEFLGNASAKFLTIAINHKKLRKTLNQVRREFQQLISQVIQQGGSMALISHYFGT